MLHFACGTLWSSDTKIDYKPPGVYNLNAWLGPTPLLQYLKTQICMQHGWNWTVKNTGFRRSNFISSF